MVDGSILKKTRRTFLKRAIQGVVAIVLATTGDPTGFAQESQRKIGVSEFAEYMRRLEDTVNDGLVPVPKGSLDYDLKRIEYSRRVEDLETGVFKWDGWTEIGISPSSILEVNIWLGSCEGRYGLEILTFPSRGKIDVLLGKVVNEEKTSFNNQEGEPIKVIAFGDLQLGLSMQIYGWCDQSENVSYLNLDEIKTKSERNLETIHRLRENEPSDDYEALLIKMYANQICDVKSLSKNMAEMTKNHEIAHLILANTQHAPQGSVNTAKQESLCDLISFVIAEEGLLSWDAMLPIANGLLGSGLDVEGQASRKTLLSLKNTLEKYKISDQELFSGVDSDKLLLCLDPAYQFNTNRTKEDLEKQYGPCMFEPINNSQFKVNMIKLLAYLTLKDKSEWIGEEKGVSFKDPFASNLQNRFLKAISDSHKE